MAFSSHDFPNRFDYAQSRPRIYAFWEEHGYFHSEPDRGRQPYAIVIPPPNVTGALHLGHALNNTLQDILIRMKRMQGFNVLWMPGTDHAGIATQAVVEKRLLEEEGKTRHDLGREELVERIWEWKGQYEARILSQLKQMGCSCDWQRTRFTLDETCARAVRQTFFDLFRKGLIYRGKRLVNWDTHLQTAVSDDEVFHETVQGNFWHFRYPVIDPQPGEPTHVTIATTRPETMLGDTAVAVHPDPAGALDRAEADLAEKLAKSPGRERAEIQVEIDNIRTRRQSMLAQLETLRDMARDGRMLNLPLLNRRIPLIADEWAKPELGSGCVKITPAHDPNDYDVWQRHPEIGAVNILNPDGTLNENAGKYAGCTINAARNAVVADLDALGLLGEIEDREIDLAHSDRSKTPIEPYLADQWFVRMDELAQSAMNAVTCSRTKIVPERYAKTYLDWLSEKRDWCIGRQLWWGHRVPVWTVTLNLDSKWLDVSKLGLTRPTPHGIVAAEIGKLFSELEDKTGHQVHCVDPSIPLGTTRKERTSGVGSNLTPTMQFCTLTPDADAIFERLVSELDRKHQGKMVLSEFELATEYVTKIERDADVLDTWFSSALWPHSTLGWPEETPELAYYYPTSVLITSRDIITLWVARMVLTGLNNMGEVPFREVFIHPKILDGYGETMSKSKGNGIDPLDVIDNFGPDALRFAMAYLTTETQDVRMPVQFECPHCQSLMDQTKKNRELPRIACKKCGEEFSTQWASKDEDKVLPRGAVVSERFELARNFCNKLWNASRFALLNLTEFTAGPVAERELVLEDRWILSRLATITRQVTEALESYQYADAARTLYDFAWDEFCSFYIEMVKARLHDPAQQAVAKRVLAHTLDTLLRLLHPMIPFITEEVWQLFAKVAPQRGLPQPEPAARSIMIAPWPTADLSRQDPQIEARFARFQSVLSGLREIRSRQNIPPKAAVEFCVRCDDEAAELLRPMEPYFRSMANASSLDWGSQVQPPDTHAAVRLQEMEVYVDLKDFIDVEAEIARNKKEAARIQGLIQAKENKLANPNFVNKAPAELVERERDALVKLREQLSSVEASLEALRQR